MPSEFRPESDAQLIPYYQYNPEIHEIDYRYVPAPSGETYTHFNPTFGATDYRFFPVVRPFYPFPFAPFGGYYGYPYGYGGYGYHPHGFHKESSPSR